MIKVIITSGLGNSKSVVVASNTQIKTILQDNNINANGKLIYIGSMAVTDHSKTLAELGVADECELTYATKADGGLL